VGDTTADQPMPYRVVRYGADTMRYDRPKTQHIKQNQAVSAIRLTDTGGGFNHPIGSYRITLFP
jgi:hypothetical protein